MSKLKELKPLFQHDCYNCQFLGHYKGHDLYYCDSEPTVIARYGKEGGEYKSGLRFATKDGNDNLLYEAKKRAIKVGLIIDN